MILKKSKIRDRILELLKVARKGGKHHGLLLAFSDMSKIIAKGAYPIGTKKKEFEEVCDIFSKKAEELISNFQEDGAILINKKGIVHLPPVYLNVNIFHVDESQIHNEFGSRHISALACSSATKSHIYVLSEETNKIREFHKGEVELLFPEQQEYDLEPEEVKKQIIKQRLKPRTIKIETS